MPESAYRVKCFTGEASVKRILRLLLLVSYLMVIPGARFGKSDERQSPNRNP